MNNRNSVDQAITFEPIVRDKLSEIIITKLKEKVFSGELRTGDKLPSERELVQQFDTSRITVREAIKTLETLGLIEIRRGSSGGAFVRAINSTCYSDLYCDMLGQGLIDISDITEVRLMMEPQIAKLAAERASKKDIIQMKACIDEAKLHLLEPKIPRSTNIHFHNLVAESTHNRMIYLEITAITRIMIKNVDYSSLDNYSISKTIERHERIFKAIENGDSELASREMYNDIEMIHSALKKAQKESIQTGNLSHNSG